MGEVITIRCDEVEYDGQLLRFASPLLVEQHIDEDGTVSFNSPLFDLSAAGTNEAEAWEMFSDLIISTYQQYHSIAEPPVFIAARNQWEAARGLKAKLYVLQPV